MHPFLINQTFSLLFSSNQGMTLKQGCRIANIAWTPFSVRISERSQKTWWLTWSSLQQASAFNQGSWCAWTRASKKNWEKKHALSTGLYFLVASSGEGQRVHAGPFQLWFRTWYVFNNQIILFSVRCDGLRANSFLIRRLSGWSQQLIVSWSRTPEPIGLGGMKVCPPLGCLLSEGACRRVSSNEIELLRVGPAHTSNLTKKETPPAPFGVEQDEVTELCTKSWPRSWRV